MWRPKDWDELKSNIINSADLEWTGHLDSVLEASADAILEVLLNDRNIITVWQDTLTMPGFMTDSDKHIRSLGNGRWVFIPEEE